MYTVAPTGSRPLRARQPGCFLESGPLILPPAALGPLSPCGDGNSQPLSIVWIAKRRKPYPLRGRKPALQKQLSYQTRYDAISYPLRGRQHMLCSHVNLLRDTSPCTVIGPPIVPFPRKRLASSAAGGALPLSPQGDGNPSSLVASSSQSSTQCLAPQGDGNQASFSSLLFFI